MGRRALPARDREAVEHHVGQTTAAANGARYVDTYTAAIGHDACKSSSTRWVEPLVPGNTAAPFHPNARGMAGVTPAIVAAAR